MKRILFLFFLSILAGNLKAAVFTVISNANAGGGTLREAILLANANGTASLDYIYFNLPGSTAADVSIALETELPILTSNIIIDGTTQPFSALSNPNIKISLVRVVSDYFNGLRLDNGNNIEIYGISFSNFKADPLGPIDEKKGGIYLRNSTDIIIGAPNKPNCFGGNYAGILSPFVIPRLDVERIKISSNIFGLGENGLNSVPNESGIDVSFIKNSIIGGDTPDEGNLMANNTRNGIALGGADGNIKIANNIIGLDINSNLKASALANGIYINGSGSVPVITSNIISGQLKGILVDYVNGGFKIINNKIGTGKLGTENYSNEIGIHVNFSNTKSIIGGVTMAESNLIAYNKVAVLIENSYPISVLRNSIYCNSDGGILFKNQTAEPAKINTITANSASGTYLPNATVELFYDDECPDCQGRYWIATLQTDASGNWQYNGSLTGSLTSTGTNADGATSGFSKPLISDGSKKITDVYCGAANGSITGLTISDASVFTWLNAANEQVGNTRDLTNVPAGVYYLKAGQPGGCDVLSASYTIKNIAVNYKVKASKIIPASCNEKNGSITVLGYETESPTVFTWTDEKGNVVGNTEILQNVFAGNYTLTASNGSSCTNVAGVFSVGITSPPIINLSKMQQFISCDGKTISASGIEIVGNTAPYTYNWINADGNTVFEGLNIENIKPDKYTLTVNDKFGCTVSTESIDFTQLENKVLLVPNSITPNGDGTNDTWKIAGAANYPDAEFYVFNRNGDKVFYSKGYDKEFDGTHNGKPLSVGVYYYLIDLKTTCGKLTGSLTILK